MEAKLKKIMDGVFIVTENFVFFDKNMVTFIKKCAAGNPRKRARICAHKEPTDAIHEMLIAIGHDSYIRPHKHINKTESFHVVEGKADVIIFSDNGDIADIVELRHDRKFFYRLDEPNYHTLLIHSPMFVMHEVTNGPFNSQQCNFASFAPAEESSETCAYILQLQKYVLAWKKRVQQKS